MPEICCEHEVTVDNQGLFTFCARRFTAGEDVWRHQPDTRKQRAGNMTTAGTWCNSGLFY